MKMENLARALDKEENFLEYGTVKLAEGGAFTVAAESGVVAAKRSFSCLVEPLPRDMVLLFRGASGCYILAILERHGDQHACLSFEGDADLRLKQGRLRVAAQEGIDLVSAKDTEIDQLKAGQLNYLVKKLMSLRGKHSVLTAEEDVRIDGDKILMG